MSQSEHPLLFPDTLSVILEFYDFEFEILDVLSLSQVSCKTMWAVFTIRCDSLRRVLKSAQVSNPLDLVHLYRTPPIAPGSVFVFGKENYEDDWESGVLSIDEETGGVRYDVKCEAFWAQKRRISFLRKGQFLGDTFPGNHIMEFSRQTEEKWSDPVTCAMDWAFGSGESSKTNACNHRVVVYRRSDGGLRCVQNDRGPKRWYDEVDVWYLPKVEDEK